MFEDSLFDSGGRPRTKSPITVAISFLVQSIAVGILILIPLFYTEALPRQRMLSFLLAPPAPAPQRRAAPPRTVAVTLKPQPPRPMVEPIVIPEHAAIVHDDPLPPAPSGGIVNEALAIGNDTSGIFPRDVVVAPPPPPPPAPERPVIIGGQVMAARLVSQLKPVYPPLARQARIQGVVKLAAMISKDGSIANLTVLSGHPLLIPAAMEAVRQWRYQPTRLNSVAVEVETTIDVNFVLGG